MRRRLGLLFVIALGSHGAPSTGFRGEVRCSNDYQARLVRTLGP